jgi:predicted AAA+ superfamily ATPase
MRNVTESMAGRSAVLQMWPMSAQETSKVNLLLGGYPEVLARPRDARLWFASYLQTYLERDVRAMTAVQDLSTFRRFFALVASRHGQVLNRSDIAAPLGVSVPTVQRWLDVLEATGQILLLPPFYENFGKRLVKSPKLYVADSGLACHLLGIETKAELAKSPFRGALFEGLVASELVKQQTNDGLRREVWWFRDQKGLEVDFLVPTKGGGLRLIEAKAGSSVRPEAAASMLKLRDAIARAHRRGRVEMILAYESLKAATTAAEGVRAVGWRDLFAI